MKTFATIALVATGVMSAAISGPIEKRHHTGSDLQYGNKIVNSAAYGVFLKTDVQLDVKLDLELNGALEARQVPEPDSNRNEANPDIVFMLFCTDAGFRGDCLVFGAKPGKCVSFDMFESPKSTKIVDTFNDKVTSLSSNTGGNCQFFTYKGCNDKGDDRGVTSSYNYNLAQALPNDPNIVRNDNQITSWRC